MSSSSSASAPTSSPSSKLAAIEKNQEDDLQSIKRNKRNIDKNFSDVNKNYRDITKANGRIKELKDKLASHEARFLVLEKRLSDGKSAQHRPATTPASKSKPPSRRRSKTKKDIGTKTERPTDNELKILDMQAKSKQLQIIRSALIAFNKMNAALPKKERYVWQRTIPNKDGTFRTQKYDRIVDNKSLEFLLMKPATKTAVDTILVSEGGPELDITATIKKKYWVFLKDGKLTTLSKDFKGGVGSEYLWTEDASLGRPSADWRLATKRATDPRRGFVDPRTKAMWVPEEDVIEVKEEGDGAAGAGCGADDDDACDTDREEARGAKGVDSRDDSGDDSSSSSSSSSSGSGSSSSSSGSEDDDDNDDHDAGGSVNGGGSGSGGVDSGSSLDGSGSGAGSGTVGSGSEEKEKAVVQNVAPVVGSKHPAEYGNTSSDSDSSDSESDDEKENAPPKRARVM